MTVSSPAPARGAAAAAAAADRVAALRQARRRRHALVLTVTLALGLALAAVALALGAAGLTPGRALAGALGLGDPGDVFVVQRLRLPRVLAALFAGAAFALAGALFQSTLRNPLASPDILGVSTGASLGAVWALLGLGVQGVAVAGFAFGGALAAALAIWLLAWRRGLHSIRFVLVGVGVAYVCGSLLAWLMARAEVREAQTALRWTIGSVADVRGTPLALLVVGVVVLGAAAVAVSRTQPALTLGDDNARALGVRVDAARVTTLLVAVGLVAVATSAAGPIAFVALVAPAVARGLLDDGGSDLVASTAVGAVLVLAADVVGQHALGSLVAPAGVVTGIVGAPYLLWLLSGRSSSGRKVRA
ncbi:FecCD family ABC transporter permease [Puerhibacterium sp. TATVAM-FAB25]|uniref:FecCD family ABC transporter permease n=1 Tax=Puerhibacterium sp. TATVAM-FAB25 TaxID=3093699 RepID=UPI00397C0E0F